jgi:hypothetical protein
MAEGTVLAGDWYAGVWETTTARYVAPLRRRKRLARESADYLNLDLANNTTSASGESVIAPSHRIRYLTSGEEKVFALALARSVRLIRKGDRQ